jgi:hypothetical protein
MRVHAIAFVPVLLVSLVACGARTDLVDPATDEATLVDGGGVVRPTSDASVPGTDGGPVVFVDGGSPSRDAAVDAALPPRDAGTVRDAGSTRDSGVTPGADSGALQQCTQCALQQCPQQATACFANPQCVQGVTCASQCFAGGATQQAFACVQACNIPQAQQQTIFSLLQCLGQRCQSQCANLANGG